MVRQVSRLTALAVTRSKTPGMYPDGGGLYLQVSETKTPGEVTRSWIFRYTLAGRAREMGLGSLNDITLAEARERAQGARKQKAEGIDPIAARDAERAARRAEAATAMSFKDAAQAYIRSHRAGWRNAKHGDQWEATLASYAYPLIGGLSVAAIDTALVMKVLDPIWQQKTETASRLRGRIERILDWATVSGYRRGENPARWRGHLQSLLPPKTKVQAVQHHAALPYGEVPSFMAALKQQSGSAADALRLVILTAVRTSEAIGARWEEIDLDAKLWIIPPERIKSAREHRVPLSVAAVALLQSLQGSAPRQGLIFPYGKKHISNNAMLALLRRMKRTDITVHGFRSSFRDWAAEQTNFPREVAEMALAHVVSDKVEAAYRRGDLMEKRRKLMEAWSGYVGSPPAAGKVVSMHRKMA
ncbi:tyrosine-type recombinase/integrase [Dongia sp.]|uniref:tyrosine-type recombinase/integrase n=1 Tax=Dongia sp. TaxID=1977262 RepID=UPI0037505F9F